MRFKVAKRLEEVEKVLCSKWDASEFIPGVVWLGLPSALSCVNRCPEILFV